MQSVLILEDEALIADLLEATLVRAGFHVVGTAATQDQARSLLAKDKPSIALLDINLGATERSYDFAREIRKLDIPYVFFTGYETTTLPDDLAGSHVMPKTTPRRQIAKVVETILSTQTAKPYA
ncbi:hypothetical protein BVC71_12780 [Marivivens niveibacter]|uniref:Response regulatory domain-containing protein n=1 Tax=Marivivens niveibacter TaxID=1930667 RepID=A0A251WVU3_9RHOB|nr:response regulator [Marivivens niveibacter]OUD08381.1 hypothetical protein BVC71_12780 [Marivivens niveibacter]